MSQRGGMDIDIGTVIDERPMSGLQVYIVALAAAIMFMEGYDMQAMAMAVPALAAHWSLPAPAFGPPLAAHIVGIALASSFIGPLGDRYGRQRTLVYAMFALGAAVMATGFAATINELIFWRAMTGAAIGVCIPNLSTLTSEYAPSRRRAQAVMVMFCHVPIGSFAAGFIAPGLIEGFGWQSIFMVGGGVMVVLALLTATTVPESASFLLLRRPQDPRLARILARIAPGIDRARLVALPAAARGGSVTALLSPAYRNRTALLWAIFVANTFVLMILVSWLPIMLGEAGFTPAQALQGAVTIQAGGLVGGLLLSRQIDRGRAVPALLVANIVTIASLWLFGMVPPLFSVWAALLLIVGFGIAGTQLSLIALTTTYYPSEIRATGVGWAGAAGQVGGVMGPLVGGLLLQSGGQTVDTLAMLIVPVLLCCVGITMLRPEWRVQ